MATKPSTQDKLSLPSNATANDLRQIVEGKLHEMDHEPGNLQVATEESPTTETLRLLNAYGPIISVGKTSHFKISRKKLTTDLNPTWAYRRLK